MRARSAGALLSAALLAGCADLSTPLPGTTKLLDTLPRVENSRRSPCWQQRQIAAQNSYLASIKAGSETVYKAPCDAGRVVAAK